MVDGYLTLNAGNRLAIERDADEVGVTDRCVDPAVLADAQRRTRTTS